MQPWLIVLLVITGILLIAFIALMIYGNKMQKKSEAAQQNMLAGAQTYSLLVIDKKMMKLKDAGFPKVVLDQTPKYLRGSKVPVVKAKIGPKVTTLMCDAKIFDLIPVKKEVKAVMNGIYIIDVKGLRSGLETKQPKQGFFKRMKAKFKKQA
ncbi:MAG: hypothetical protein ACI4FZ_11980 [Lachnospiraceae bacterium]